MDIDQVREFVRRHHRAVLATRTKDGGIQQSPVLVVVDDEGRFVVSSRETAYKVKNLQRDPWAQLCVFTDKFFGSWYYLEGQASVLGLPDAMEALEGYYRAAVGEHEDWDAYRASMEDEQRVVVRIEAERAGPDHSGRTSRWPDRVGRHDVAVVGARRAGADGVGAADRAHPAAGTHEQRDRGRSR